MTQEKPFFNQNKRNNNNNNNNDDNNNNNNNNNLENVFSVDALRTGFCLNNST